MSSTNATFSSYSSEFILRTITLTFGLVIFFFGIIGNLLNIIFFISLGSYKDNTCSFYVLVRSIFDFFILLLGLGTRILSQHFQIDFTIRFSIWCKIRVPLIYINTLNSYACLCFESIDTYLVTCLSLSMREKSNIRLGRYLILFSICFWTIEEIPYVIFQERQLNINRNEYECLTKNPIYSQYRIYFIYLFSTTIIPILVLIGCHCLTFRNLRIRTKERRILSLNIFTRQMIKMTIANCLSVFIFQGPFAISQCYFLSITITDSKQLYIQQFFNILGYGVYAVRKEMNRTEQRVNFFVF